VTGRDEIKRGPSITDFQPKNRSGIRICAPTGGDRFLFAPCPKSSNQIFGVDWKLPTSKRDQIAITPWRLVAPQRPAQATRLRPTRTPQATLQVEATLTVDRDVASASPPPPLSQSEHSEEEEDEPGQDDLEEVSDEDGPDDNGPSKDPEDPPVTKPHKTPVTSFLSLEHASTLQSQGDLPSGRAVNPAVRSSLRPYTMSRLSSRQVIASGWLAFLPPSGTTTARRTPRMDMAVWKLSSRWNLSELVNWLGSTTSSMRMIITIFSWLPA